MTTFLSTLLLYMIYRFTLKCHKIRNFQVGLVAVALHEGIYVGEDGASLSYEEQQHEQQQREEDTTEGGDAAAAAAREVRRIAFGSCT